MVWYYECFTEVYWILLFFETVKGKDGLNQDLCSSLILPDKNSVITCMSKSLKAPMVNNMEIMYIINSWI